MRIPRYAVLVACTILTTHCVTVERDTYPSKDASRTDVRVQEDGSATKDLGALDQGPAVDTPPIEEDTAVLDVAPEPDTAPRMDQDAPSWGDNATLQASNQGEDHLILTWTAASDASGLSAYLVYQDDVLVTKLAPMYLSLQLSQLSPGTSYAYRVEAEDTLGNLSNNGPTLLVSLLDETVPSWDANSVLLPSNVTATSVELGWPNATDNVAVATYRVYRDNIDIGHTNADTNSFSVDGLKSWKSYSFRVEAEDANGNASVDGPSVVVQTGDDTAPTWGSNATIVASGESPHGVFLGWDAATDDVAVTAYQVLQDKVQVAMLDGNTTWFEVTALAPWTQYSFEVYAWDAGGNSTSNGLAVDVFTPDNQAPSWASDSALLPSNVTGDTATLAWNPADDDVGVTGYRLYQDNVEIGTYAGDILTATVSGLDSVVQAVFRVEAEDAAGNLSFGGPASTVDLTDKLPPVWPVDAQCNASSIQATSVQISWPTATDNIGIGGYQILSDGAEIKVVGTAQNSTIVDELTPMTDYTFSVIAVDTAGNTTVNALSVSVTTADYPATTWPTDATLTPSDVMATTLTLTWSAAGNDPPITGYRVYQDDVLLTDVDDQTTSLNVTGLIPNNTYDFRVEAVGPTGHESDTGPTASVTTPDYAPPSWPATATLDISNLTETSVTLSWAPLDGTSPVDTYQVFQDGQLIQSVDSATTSLAVTGLVVATVYTFTVEAAGPTGQTSTNGPSVQVKTPDMTAPSWPTGATLTVLTVTANSVDLSWTAATDNIGVVAYEVLQDGNKVAKVSGTTASIAGLADNTTFTFQVLAGDDADLWTADGPTASATTAPSQASLTNENVYNALKNDCNECHTTGSDFPFMGTLADFNTLLVGDPQYIIPGDPDGSEVILMMEGIGTQIFVQMPLTGKTFKEESDEGNTQITIQEVRDWIAAM